MKSFLFLLSLLALVARRPAHAFAPNSPVSAAPKQTLRTSLRQEESSTALEAYAIGAGYTNGNNLMYDSRYGRSGYGGYGGYRGGHYDRPHYGGGGGGYPLAPNGFGGRGYGGYTESYMSPYRYNGYYNDRFDMNRRYFNTWYDRRYDSPYRSGYYNGYNRLESSGFVPFAPSAAFFTHYLSLCLPRYSGGGGYGGVGYSGGYGGGGYSGGYGRYGRGYNDSPAMEMARMRGAEEMRRRDYGYGGYGSDARYGGYGRGYGGGYGSGYGRGYGGGYGGGYGSGYGGGYGGYGRGYGRYY